LAAGNPGGRIGGLTTAAVSSSFTRQAVLSGHRFADCLHRHFRAECDDLLAPLDGFGGRRQFDAVDAELAAEPPTKRDALAAARDSAIIDHGLPVVILRF